MADPFTLPEEYKYLLDLPRIDADVIRKNKDLSKALSREPTKLRHFVKRNIAAISLNFARDYIESETPVFINAILGDVRQFQIGPKEKPRFKFDAAVRLPPERNSPDFTPVSLSDFIRLEVDGKVVLTGRIYKLSECEIKFRGELRSKMPVKGTNVNIFKQLLDFVPKAISTAIDRIRGGALNHLVMPEPDVGQDKKFNTSFKLRLVKFAEENPEVKDLNQEQQLAVYVIVKGLHKPSPFILFGPPGTGKTVTIVATLRQLIKCDNNRILVCTPSNTAADRVAKEILKYLDEDEVSIGSEDEQVEPRMKTGFNRDSVLRFVSPSVDFEKRDRSLDIISNVTADGYTSFLKLHQFKIIICTLATSSRLCGDEFSHIIIDEAGQASESEIWIPIGCCATRRTSVILCGDPKQLGPVNTLNLPKEFSGYMECPLKRYMRIHEYREEKRFCIQLTKCFRCHGDLVDITSELFYEGKLTNAGDQEWKNELCQHKFWLNQRFPLMFIDVRKKPHQNDPQGPSLSNPAEARVVCRIVKHLTKRMNIDFDKIGIVSPYKYHTKILREMIMKKFGEANSELITVDSVERFQGNEREAIIITTARTEGHGFLFCNLRLNTALTRAQRLLVVVGSRETLEKHNKWNEFITFVEDNKGYHKHNPFRNPNKKPKKKHWAKKPIVVGPKYMDMEIKEDDVDLVDKGDDETSKTSPDGPKAVEPPKFIITTRRSTKKRKTRIAKDKLI